MLVKEQERQRQVASEQGTLSYVPKIQLGVDFGYVWGFISGGLIATLVLVGLAGLIFCRLKMWSE